MNQLIIDGTSSAIPMEAYSALPKPHDLQVSIRMNRMDSLGGIYADAGLVANLIFVVKTSGLDEWLLSKSWDLAAAYVANLYKSTIPNKPKAGARITFETGEKSYRFEIDDVAKLPGTRLTIKTMKSGNQVFEEIVLEQNPDKLNQP